MFSDGVYMFDSLVLLLNQNFEPLTVCSAKRALIMMIADKAEMVEGDGEYVHTVRTAYRLPVIVRLKKMVQTNRLRMVKLSKHNIIRRDNRTCQYCGRRDGPMTIDHVIPRSLGGRDTWHNLVCACPDCNNIKGDRLPEEAGMRLMKLPREPHYSRFMFNRDLIHKSWKPYLKI